MGKRRSRGDPRSMTSTATPVLPATLTLGAVSLTVSDLDRSVAWYQTSLGLRVHTHEGTTATLGDGEFTVLELVEDPQARPAGRHAGLYHYALLYPSREELARAADPPLGHPDADRGRLRPPHPRGDLPARPGRQRHRARRRPPQERVARRPRLRRRPGRAGLRRAAGDRRGRGRPRPRSAPACAWATCTCTSATSSRASRFYRDVLGFEVQANLGSAAFVSRRRLPPPPRLQHLARPRRRPRPRAHRRPAPLDRRRPGHRPRSAPASTTPRTSTAASSPATRGARRSPSSRACR